MALVLAGPDEADAHGVDEDAVRRELLRQGLGHRLARGAAHRGRHAAGGRRLGADVRHVDDAPAATLAHERDHEPYQADRGEQLEVEIGLPGLVRDRFELAGGGGARVVDEDVDAAEGMDRRTDQAGQVLGLRYVGDDGQDLAARVADVDGEAVEGFLAARADRDARAFGGEPLGGGAPYALAGARDDRDPSGKSEFHRSPPLDVVAANRPAQVESCPSSAGGNEAARRDVGALRRRRGGMARLPSPAVIALAARKTEGQPTCQATTTT